MTRFFTNAIKSEISKSKIATLPEECREIAKTKGGEIKPLVFVSVDGGPDEPPKNQQTMAAGIRHFTRYDMDTIFFCSCPRI